MAQHFDERPTQVEVQTKLTATECLTSVTLLLFEKDPYFPLLFFLYCRRQLKGKNGKKRISLLITALLKEDR